MTLFEIINSARELLKDEIDSSRTFPDNTSSFITDGEMTNWFNRSQEEIQNRLIQSYENYFVTATSINLVANQEEYSMPCGCIKIIRVEDITNTSAPIEIYPIPFGDKDKYTPAMGLDVTALGNIQAYAVKGNSFVFRPRPSTAQASGVRVYYERKVDALNSASSCSTIPDQYHEALIWGIVKRGYIKQEASAEALTIASGEYKRAVEDMIVTAESRQAQRSRRVRKTRR